MTIKIKSSIINNLNDNVIIDDFYRQNRFLIVRFAHNQETYGGYFVNTRGTQGRVGVEIEGADAPKEISVEKEKNDLKKFLEQERKLTDLVSDIFSDQLMDEIYVRLDKFERMVIWCTYPELTLEEIEIIEEMIVENYSAEEILNAMELEDRSGIMQEVIDTLCQLTEDKWEEFLMDSMMAKADLVSYNRYMDLKNQAALVYYGGGILQTKRKQEGKTKTWEIFETMESARETRA